MKLNYLTFTLLILLISCKEIKSDKVPNGAITVNQKENQFRDSTLSGLNLKQDKNGSIIEKYRNVNYSSICFKYMGELKNAYKREVQDIEITRGMEGRQCVIDVDLFDIETGKNLKTIKENADAIKFEYDYYSISHWGCCGAEDKYELKNLATNKTFLEYNEKYYSVSVPNSDIKLFFGYRPTDRQGINNRYVLNDGLIVGKLTYADMNGKINEVVIHAKDEYTYQGILHWTPEMRFKLANKDQLRENEAVLWSKDGVKELKNIDGFEFQIIISDENSNQIDTIKLPIINGFIKGIQSTKIDETVNFISQ